PRPRDQARREVQPAPHASGVLAYRSIRGVREVEALQQLAGAPACLISREAEKTSEHHKVLAPAEDLIDSGELSGQPEQLPHGVRVRDDVAAEHRGAPLIGAEQRRQHAHERRLAGAVWPEQPKYHPLLDVEVYARE